MKDSYEQRIQNQFGAFCVKVLKNEAGYIQREYTRLRDQEKSLGELTAFELEQTAVWDKHFLDEHVLDMQGLPVVVTGNLLADALAQLPEGRELSFSDLPQMEMDKLCVVDHYPSDRFTFSSHGYDLHIENELVADAFAGLSVQEQSILILHFVLDLPDQEVGHLVGMSRSAVQRRRAKSLTELRIKLAALMPKGG